MFPAVIAKVDPRLRFAGSSFAAGPQLGINETADARHVVETLSTFFTTLFQANRLDCAGLSQMKQIRTSKAEKRLDAPKVRPFSLRSYNYTGVLLCLHVRTIH